MKSKKVKNFLSREEEKSLIEEYQKTRSNHIANKLLIAHAGFINKMAMKFNKSNVVPFDDILQEARLGFVYSIEKFKPELNLRLNTYSVHWIKAYVTLYIFKNAFNIKVNRSIPTLSLYFKLNKVKSEIEKDHPTFNEDDVLLEVSKRLNVKLDAVTRFNSLIQPAAQLYDAETTSFAANPEEILIIEEAPKEIMNQMASLNLQDREKEIVHTLFLDAKEGNLATLGKRWNVSPQRVQQIEAGLFARIKQNYTAQTFLK